MTFKACKYCNVTQIQWDTELNAFRESDGTIHDRPRCENQRVQHNQRVQESVTTTTTTRQIPREDWDKLVDLITKISHNTSLMVVHYDGLVEQQRLLTRMITKPLDEKLAEQETRYDQDREDGII
jgi:ATP-dependent phosphoenolpyruvate carboxykinase